MAITHAPLASRLSDIILSCSDMHGKFVIQNGASGLDMGGQHDWQPSIQLAKHGRSAGLGCGAHGRLRGTAILLSVLG